MAFILQTFIAQLPGAYVPGSKISKSLTNPGRTVLCKQVCDSVKHLTVKTQVRCVVTWTHGWRAFHEMEGVRCHLQGGF